MHDDAVDESKSPARVGLAIKGIAAEQISRGDILCSSDSYVKIISSPVPATMEASTSTSTSSHAKFVKNPYYKGDLAENQTYLISVGLQIKPVRLKILDNIMIEIMPENKPIVFLPGQTYVLLKSDNQGTRIIGNGTLGRS